MTANTTNTTLIKSKWLQSQLKVAIESGRHLILTADTGSGKSVVTTGLLAKSGRRAVVAQPRIANVMSVHGIAKKVFGGDLGWRTAEDGRNTDAATLVVTDGLAVANEALIKNSDVVVIDEIHEFSTNQISLLYLAKRAGKQIILLSATIDSKLQALMGYIDAQHLNFSGARSYPTTLKTSTSLKQIATAEKQHKSVLCFGAGKRELSDMESDLIQVGVPMSEIAILTAETQQQYLAELLGERPTSIRYWLATNVAQAGITPAACDAVFISGIKKEVYAMGFNDNLKVVSISKEDFTQQAGRTGRVCPGTVYTSLSDSEVEGLPASSIPQIQRARVHDVYLNFLSKKMRLEVVAEDLLFRPSDASIQSAKEELLSFGCIDSGGLITARGQLAARLPMDIGLALGLTYAHALDVVKPYVTYAASKQADNKYTLADLRAGRKPAKGAAMHRSRNLIYQAYNANKRLIANQAERMPIPAEAAAKDPIERVGIALLLSAPAHNLVSYGKELHTGDYTSLRADSSDALVLFDTFAYRGRVLGNELYCVRDIESPIAQMVLTPESSTKTVYRLSGYATVTETVVKARNGKVIREVSMEGETQPYDFTRPEHLAQMLERASSMREVAQGFGYTFTVDYYSSSSINILAQPIDRDSWLELAKAAEDAIDLAEVLAAFNEAMEQRFAAPTTQDVIDAALAQGLPRPKVTRNDRESKATLSYDIAKAQPDASLPATSTSQGFDLVHIWLAEVEGTTFYPADHAAYEARKAQILRVKAQERLDRAVQNFKNKLPSSRSVSLQKDEPTNIEEVIADEIAPHFEVISVDGLEMVVSYRYHFSKNSRAYSAYWNELTLQLTFDNEEVQDYESDTEKVIAAVQAEMTGSTRIYLDDADADERIKAATVTKVGEQRIEKEGVLYPAILTETWYSRRHDQVIIAPEDTEVDDDAIKVEGDVWDFVEGFNADCDAAEDVIHDCHQIADEAYELNAPNFSFSSWKSKLDKLRNVVEEDPKAAKAKALTYRGQLRGIVTKSKPNSIGNMIDLSGLEGLFK